MKIWDVTFVRYVSMEIKAETEEEARAIAETKREPTERIGVIEEVDPEEDYE